MIQDGPDSQFPHTAPGVLLEAGTQVPPLCSLPSSKQNGKDDSKKHLFNLVPHLLSLRQLSTFQI